MSSASKVGAGQLKRVRAQSPRALMRWKAVSHAEAAIHRAATASGTRRGAAMRSSSSRSQTRSPQTNRVSQSQSVSSSKGPNVIKKSSSSQLQSESSAKGNDIVSNNNAVKKSAGLQEQQKQQVPAANSPGGNRREHSSESGISPHASGHLERLRHRAPTDEIVSRLNAWTQQLESIARSTSEGAALSPSPRGKQSPLLGPLLEAMMRSDSQNGDPGEVSMQPWRPATKSSDNGLPKDDVIWEKHSEETDTFQKVLNSIMGDVGERLQEIGEQCLRQNSEELSGESVRLTAGALISLCEELSRTARALDMVQNLSILADEVKDAEQGGASVENCWSEVHQLQEDIRGLRSHVQRTRFEREEEILQLRNLQSRLARVEYTAKDSPMFRTSAPNGVTVNPPQKSESSLTKTNSAGPRDKQGEPRLQRPDADPSSNLLTSTRSSQSGAWSAMSTGSYPSLVRKQPLARMSSAPIFRGGSSTPGTIPPVVACSIQIQRPPDGVSSPRCPDFLTCSSSSIPCVQPPPPSLSRTVQARPSQSVERARLSPRTMVVSQAPPQGSSYAPMIQLPSPRAQTQVELEPKGLHDIPNLLPLIRELSRERLPVCPVGVQATPVSVTVCPVGVQATPVSVFCPVQPASGPLSPLRPQNVHRSHSPQQTMIKAPVAAKNVIKKNETIPVAETNMPRASKVKLEDLLVSDSTSRTQGK